jgi:hypothetical protein
VVDDCTDICWSIFVPQKSDMPGKVIELINKLKQENKYKVSHIVRFIRCDDGGENKVLETQCNEKGLGVTFEYTGPGSPQYNGRAERKFPTLYGRVRTMLNAAGVPENIRNGVWAEAAKTATEIENLIVTETKPVASFHRFYKIKDFKLKKFHPFGEIAVVEKNNNRGMKGKLENRGRACMYLGHADNHTEEVGRFLDLVTLRVIMSRDVIWLGKNYAEWKGLKEYSIVDHDSDDSDEEDFEPGRDPVTVRQIQPNVDEAIGEAHNNHDIDDIEETYARTPPPQKTKAIRELRRLTGFFNPEVQTIINTIANSRTDPGGELEMVEPESEDSANVIIDKKSLDFGLLVEEFYKGTNYDRINPTKYKDMFVAPTSFQNAWNHECPWQKKKWREGINLEINKMKQNKVMKIVKRNTMEEGRKCIKFKWIFEIKRNGTFRARLVACGYSQIPGVDFQESFSPVINDVAFRILIICQIIWKLKALLMDVEVAFLNGDLDEMIYMEVPDGFEHQPDEVVLLLKSMYGLVQAALQFFKKFKAVLLKIGFTQSVAEPCLFIKRSNSKIILIVIHVDDCYVVGEMNMMEQVIKDIEMNGLKLKVEYNTNDYLSCEILFNEEKTKAWLGQPHLMKKIENSYGYLVKNGYQYSTPGTPGFGITRPKDNDTKIAETDQKVYRSVVGSLLQLVKYSRPDIANSVREISKCMDGATPNAFKEMSRLLKYVIDTKNYGLRMDPILDQSAEWNIKVFTDSDWGGDKDNRHSVSGYVIFLMGVAVMWKSKLQRTTALSSTEAEYYALSEAAKDIKFVSQILDSIGIKINYPIYVNVDNVGAIFMAENASATSRTKHVDVRYHFVREFIFEGFIKIVFVKTANNTSDIFTKNLSKELFEKHQNKFVVDKDKVNDDDWNIEGRVLGT